MKLTPEDTSESSCNHFEGKRARKPTAKSIAKDIVLLPAMTCQGAATLALLTLVLKHSKICKHLKK
jgi:hypothetical protein